MTVGGAAAGNLTPVPGYFKAIRQVCDKYGVLLVLDEIMCGMGRTGKMHAWEWEGKVSTTILDVPIPDNQGSYRTFRLSERD